jgi:iron complex outermembrane receptor protein
MSGDFDVMTPEQFVAAGGDDKGSRSYNWKMQFYKTFFYKS